MTQAHTRRRVTLRLLVGIGMMTAIAVAAAHAPTKTSGSGSEIPLTRGVLRSLHQHQQQPAFNQAAHTGQQQATVESDAPAPVAEQHQKERPLQSAPPPATASQHPPHVIHLTAPPPQLDVQREVLHRQRIVPLNPTHAMVEEEVEVVESWQPKQPPQPLTQLQAEEAAEPPAATAHPEPMPSARATEVMEEKEKIESKAAQDEEKGPLTAAAEEPTERKLMPRDEHERSLERLKADVEVREHVFASTVQVAAGRCSSAEGR